MDIKDNLRHIPDFPSQGIDFIDVTTVLQDKDAFKASIDGLIALSSDFDFDVIVGSEARGFIFGATMAYALNKGFVPVRKKGKLPYKTISAVYDLEYGSDILEMHQDAILPGQNVLIVDDLLATGGTTQSNIRLINELGGTVTGIVFLVELSYLKGRDQLPDYPVRSLVQFEE